MGRSKQTSSSSTVLMPQGAIVGKIFLIRGKKVMIDRDLAELYKVPTKALNQAVKRNSGRFPEDFMFQLTDKEKMGVVTDCDHLEKLKFSPQLPYVFTEQGVAMLSSVLNSERAIQINIQIIRTFTKLREMIQSHVELRHKIEEMGKKYDKQFKIVFDAVREILLKFAEEEKKPKKKIGFHHH